MNAPLSPTALARLHHHQGGNLGDNPYPKGSKQREEYMLEMGRLQHEEFKRELDMWGYAHG